MLDKNVLFYECTVFLPMDILCFKYLTINYALWLHFPENWIFAKYDVPK